MKPNPLCILFCLFSVSLDAASFQNPNFTTADYNLTPISALGLPGSSPELTGINNNGVAVGDYLFIGFRMGGQLGFTYFNGISTSFALPGGEVVAPVRGINNSGVVLGYYANPMGAFLGFVGQPGSLASIAVPGATETEPYAINDAGTVVGGYIGAGNVEHGFIYNTNGTFTTVDAPGATGTALTGINNLGQIVGQALGYSSDGGFLYSGGTFTPFFGASGQVNRSSVRINDAGAILIEGYHGTDILYPNGDLANIQVSGGSGDVYGFNNAGTIVAETGILTPIPEPRSLLLVLTALGLMAVCRFRFC